MGHGTLLETQLRRLNELCDVAGQMTDPDRGAKKNPRAVIKIIYADGYPREMGLELLEKLPVPEEYKKPR